MLSCVVRSAKRPQSAKAQDWIALLVDDEPVFYCPACAEREYGRVSLVVSESPSRSTSGFRRRIDSIVCLEMTSMSAHPLQQPRSIVSAPERAPHPERSQNARTEAGAGLRSHFGTTATTASVATPPFAWYDQSSGTRVRVLFAYIEPHQGAT